MAPIDKSPHSAEIIAVLGPTNTGKTFYALERMVDYKTGMIGFPLRLLARENYDRLVKEQGEHAVALITGEERIIPETARYFCCTVESMPVDRAFEFVAIDEIQLCADPERGHIFTHRLLHVRGEHETLFLGSDAMRDMIRTLVPDARFIEKARLSQLNYTGFSKITRLPPRSAIIAFSMNDVYTIAELIRRQKGGTAIVLGALSPRARNAQVALYQSGEVDYIVATDAIGMGLNMEIDHIAFAKIQKYDGERLRRLSPLEMGQIAGRAGRYKNNGTFGVTANIHDLSEELVEQLETHHFDPITQIFWRNADLDFSSTAALKNALDVCATEKFLTKGRTASDQEALNMLTQDAEIAATKQVKLLWECCQIPDFQQLMNGDHARFVGRVFDYLSKQGKIAEDWIGNHITKLDRTDGDVDTLMSRIARIRSWTYISHRDNWLKDPEAWRLRAMAVEDKLSDALHERLTTRFVNKQSARLLQSLSSKKDMQATVNSDTGEVFVEGHCVGLLNGIEFKPYHAAQGKDYFAVMNAARKVLNLEMEKRIQSLLFDDNRNFTLEGRRSIAWRGMKIATLHKGGDLYEPQIRLRINDLLEQSQQDKILRKVEEWLKGQIASTLPHTKLLNQAGLEFAARGIAFSLRENMGWIDRAELAEQLEHLTGDDRQALYKTGMIFGSRYIFMNQIFKVRARSLAWRLWTLWHDFDHAEPDIAGTATAIDKIPKLPRQHYQPLGYVPVRHKAVRVDILERVIKQAFEKAENNKFTLEAEMMNMLGLGKEETAELLVMMGCEKTDDDMVFGLGKLRHRPKKPAKHANKQAKPMNPDSPFSVLAQLKLQTTSPSKDSTKAAQPSKNERKKNKK